MQSPFCSYQNSWICHVSYKPVQQNSMRKSGSLTQLLWCSCCSIHWTRMDGFMLWSPVIRHEYIKNVCQAKWRLLQHGMYLLPGDNATRWRMGCGKMGGGGRGGIVPRQRSKFPGRRAGTIRLQGCTGVQLYTFICVNSKRQKSKHRNKDKRSRKKTNKETSKIARFNVT
jgi:hypothetical protein